MNFVEKLKADTHRIYGASSLALLIIGFVSKRTFRPVVSMRLCQWAATSPSWPHLMLPLFRVMHHFFAGQAGMDFPWRISVGPGLMLVHGWGVVVNPGASIGSNVTIFHGATIGRRDRVSRDLVRSTACPVIEDEVWIGPNAIIVGGVRLGRGCRVAGGAFVSEDVPPYSIVSGNPSTILKENCTQDVMNPAPL